jgi:PD-(D/E)XK nuclease superfamily protein
MKYIRVSEILARLQNFGKMDQAILENKQEIGKRTHKAITMDIHGEECIDHCERSRAYFDSYLDYKEHHLFDTRFMLTEARFYDDELMITGEIDAFANSCGQNVIYDWKTSASANKKIWEMQAHFYYYLMQANGIQPDCMIWVNLRHDKTPLLDDDGQPVLDIMDCKTMTYVAKKPIAYEFKFNKNVMQECIVEAQKCWEEKKANFEID